MNGREFSFETELWRWQSATSPGGWHFATLPTDMSVEIRLRTMGTRRGFGSVRVEASIGASVWRTSIFPSSDLDAFVLPVKASVRRSEGISTGETVLIGLALLDA